jgi:hypothetical protein
MAALVLFGAFFALLIVRVPVAFALGLASLPVLMIDRPQLPPRPEVQTVAQVIDWLDHSGTERGV